MELLERDGALAALANARDAAARGEGRVVFVTGEPGIGKTSLVTHFLGDLDDGFVPSRGSWVSPIRGFE